MHLLPPQCCASNWTILKVDCALAAGGGYAYYKKGSSASLQSSLTVAAALLASAWLLGVNPAFGTALGLSNTLTPTLSYPWAT